MPTYHFDKPAQHVGSSTWLLRLHIDGRVSHSAGGPSANEGLQVSPDYYMFSFVSQGRNTRVRSVAMLSYISSEQRSDE